MFVLDFEPEFLCDASEFFVYFRGGAWKVFVCSFCFETNGSSLVLEHRACVFFYRVHAFWECFDEAEALDAEDVFERVYHILLAFEVADDAFVLFFDACECCGLSGTAFADVLNEFFHEELLFSCFQCDF